VDVLVLISAPLALACIFPTRYDVVVTNNSMRFFTDYSSHYLGRILGQPKTDPTGMKERPNKTAEQSSGNQHYKSDLVSSFHS
jgi:hypothetical protein